jgi:hypothetical protein
MSYMTTCPQCGTQNLPGMAYCEHCGAPLEQEAAQPHEAVDPVAAAASAQAQSILDSLNASDQAPAQSAAPAEAAPAEAAPTEAPEEQPAAEQPAAAPSAQAPALSLVFPDGSSFAVSADVTNVGRSDVAQNWHPELDLIPFGGGAPDLGVSRHQALIQRDGTNFSIIDVGSTNGTFVNGKVLAYNKPVELHDGDAIAFGAFNAKVSIQ